MNPKNEPVTLTGLIVAAVAAIVSLVTAFGLHVSPDQAAAIIGTVTAVAAVVGFLVARTKVTPTSNVVAFTNARHAAPIAGPAAEQPNGTEVQVVDKEAA